MDSDGDDFEGSGNEIFELSDFKTCGIPLMDTSGSMCCDYVFEFQSL